MLNFFRKHRLRRARSERRGSEVVAQPGGQLPPGQEASADRRDREGSDVALREVDAGSPPPSARNLPTQYCALHRLVRGMTQS